MKVKKEWHPPDWEQQMERLRKEGMDNATIDNDLKEISHQEDTGRSAERSGARGEIEPLRA